MIRMLKHFINRSGFFAIGNTEEMEENVGFLFFCEGSSFQKKK